MLIIDFSKFMKANVEIKVFTQGNQRKNLAQFIIMITSDMMTGSFQKNDRLKHFLIGHIVQQVVIIYFVGC